MVPLIAPKHFSEHTPDSWIAFVKTLKESHEEKPKARLKFRRLKKGGISVTVPKSRVPAYALMTEVEELARANDCPISEIYNAVRAKKVMVIQTKLKEKK